MTSRTMKTIDRRPAADILAKRMRRDRVAGDVLPVVFETSERDTWTDEETTDIRAIVLGVFVGEVMVANYGVKNGRLYGSVGRVSPRDYQMATSDDLAEAS